MTQHNSPLSASEARELLAHADGVASAATSAAGWPTAMVFNSLAILGSMLMIGMHIVAHTGYGAPLLAISVGIWAAVSSTVWSLMQRTTKSGFSKRHASSLIAYFVLYGAALAAGTLLFPTGSLAFYVSAAVVLAAVGLAAAIRELRA